MARIELGSRAVRDAQKRNAPVRTRPSSQAFRPFTRPQSLGVRPFVIDTSVFRRLSSPSRDSRSFAELDAVRVATSKWSLWYLLDEVQRGLDGGNFRERISENERLAGQRCCEPWH